MAKKKTSKKKTAKKAVTKKVSKKVAPSNTPPKLTPESFYDLFGSTPFLNVLVLLLLAQTEKGTAVEILEGLERDYRAVTSVRLLRPRLNRLMELGTLESEREGRVTVYRLTEYGVRVHKAMKTFLVGA